MSNDYFKKAVNEIIDEYNLDIWLLVAIILFGIYQFFVVPNIFVNTTDAIIDGKLMNVSTRVGGIVAQCYVGKDQEVKKGDLLVEIDPSEYQNELIKLETNLEINREKLKMLNSGIKEQTIEAKEIVEEQPSTPVSQPPRYKSTAKDITSYARTYEPEDVAEINLARRKTAMGDAISNMSEINEKNKALEDLPKPLIERTTITLTNETVESVEKEIKNLESRKEEIKLMLYSTKIYAPRDGVVSGVSIRQGDILNPSDVICSIIPKQVWVIARVNPEKLAKIKIGQSVTIRIPQYKHRKFKGVVTSVDKTSKVYKVQAKSQVVKYDEMGEAVNQIAPAYQLKIEFIEDYSDFNLVPDTDVSAKILVDL